MEAITHDTTTVRIDAAKRQALKIACAQRGISMLEAVNSAVSAWMDAPGAALNKHATEATRSRPQRAAHSRRRKSA